MPQKLECAPRCRCHSLVGALAARPHIKIRADECFAKDRHALGAHSHAYGRPTTVRQGALLKLTRFYSCVLLIYLVEN